MRENRREGVATRVRRSLLRSVRSNEPGGGLTPETRNAALAVIAVRLFRSLP
jgi:hypothetical protein